MKKGLHGAGIEQALWSEQKLWPARVTLTLSHSFLWCGFSSFSSYAAVKLSTVRWAMVASAAQARGRQQSPSSAPLNLRVAGFNLQMEQFEGILAPLRAWKITDS